MRGMIFLLFLLVAAESSAQEPRTAEPNQAILDSITERGRRLAEYDWAAWHATDALLEAIPDPSGVARYVAVQHGDVWEVSFGRLTERRDTFLVTYQAHEAPEQTHGFAVEVHKPPVPGSDATLMAARALATALSDFGQVTQSYNTAILDAPNGNLWVYIMPGQTSPDFYWHGGDARYLVSEDGNAILDKRLLHRSLMQMPIPPDSAVAGVHTAVMDDKPEDTDVFYVLTRNPLLPEIIVTEHFLYEIRVDGTIEWRLK